MLKFLCAIPLIFWGYVGLAQDHDGLEHVNFPLNSSVVVDAFQGLDLLADVMVKYPDLTLDIVGHTDVIGSDGYNKQLSVRRANSVKAYLLSRGVGEERLTVDGMGKAEFIAPNDDRDGRFLNRRVELLLYEKVDGVPKLVSYRRLIELFFGGIPKSDMVALDNQDKIMQKLSELEQQQKELRDALDKKLAMAAQPTDTAVSDEQARKTWAETSVSGRVQFNGFSGVSFDFGMDDDDDFTGRVTGQYFRAMTDRFGLQAQGEYTHYDALKEGQFDAALIYQIGKFKVGGAGSYKFINMAGFESARVGQGALIFDFVFDKGHVGLYGTSPFADGDVIYSQPHGLAYTWEQYVEVVAQYGLNFGINLGEKATLSGSVTALDTDLSSDMAADLRFDWNIRDNLTWYVDLEMNEALLTDEDSNRYATGFRFGTWGQAQYMAADQVTPITIPRIRYEIMMREVRSGNTSPFAEAGANQVDVPAGEVTLDGSASSDPEGDALTYRWIQMSGPAVEIHNAEEAVATFVGEAGAAYAFMLTVRDEFGASGSDMVNVVMEEASAEEVAPMILFFTGYPTEITEGELINLTWNTAYAETVTLSDFGQVNASDSLVFSPMESVVYTLTATNEFGTVSETVTITVHPFEEPDPNTAPVAVAGPDQFRYAAGTVMLDGSGSYDPDGDELTYQWLQISGDLVELSGADTARPTFDGRLSSAYVFRIIVSDGKGGIDTDDVLVQIF